MSGSDELTEDGIDALLQDMGKGYRFRPLMQAVILVIIIGVIAFLLQMTGILDFNVQGELTITTLVFCWILAFLFPLIVKTQTHRTHQIAMGLFWAATLSLIGTILLLIFEESPVQATSIPLLIAFLTGIGAMLFEHLNPDLITRNAKVYFGIFGVAVIFFICVWIYMEVLLPGFGIWVALITTALYAYALLPEKPK